MMKRPMLHIAIAFGTGILMTWFVKQILLILIVFFCMVLLYGYGRKKSINFLKNSLLWAVVFVLGYFNYVIQFTWLLQPMHVIYDHACIVNGYINSSPVTDERKTTFDFYIETVNSQEYEYKIERLVRVNVYGSNTHLEFSPGRYLNIDGVLKKPDGSRNPGGFNYAAYLFSKKVSATLSVNGRDISQSDNKKNLPLVEYGFKSRNNILSTLETNLTDEKAALIAAMLTGYKENLTDPMEEAFRASGLMHIMAISGAHIAFLLFPILWLFRQLGFHRKVSASLAIPLLFFYVLITGMGASVLRASLMAVVILIGKIMDRKTELINSLAVAAFILLLFNPFMLFDVGFQLSMGATAGLGLLYKRIHDSIPVKVPDMIRGTLAATMAAQAGVFPVLIRYFSKVSLISLLSNLLVVPLTGIATVLGAVVVILDSFWSLLGTWSGFMLEGVLHIILVITGVLSSIPWAEANMHHWSLWWIGLYYFVLIMVGSFGTAFFIRYKKQIVVVSFAIGMILLVQGVQPDKLKVIFIDVGQGDSALVQTPKGSTMLIDGGGSYTEEETGYIGHQVLLPVLMHEGISHIDRVLVTHAHSDHLAGILTLMEVFPVKAVGLPQYPDAKEDFYRLMTICREKETEVTFYSRGDIIDLDKETTFHVFYPEDGIYFGQSNLNNTSLSGMLNYRELQILFTGDMEQEAEEVFLEHNQWVNCDCDILKVAHHGSKSATSEYFLATVMPEMAVISVGKNHFGHPSDDVLQRLSLAETQIYTTLENGAVIVESNGDRYRVKPWYRNGGFTLLFEK